MALLGGGNKSPPHGKERRAGHVYQVRYWNAPCYVRRRALKAVLCPVRTFQHPPRTRAKALSRALTDVLWLAFSCGKDQVW